MHEQRRSPRYDVQHHGVLHVTGRSGLNVAATVEVCNISAGGLCLLSTVGAAPGDEVRVEILPDDGPPIRGLARVAWCRRLEGEQPPWTHALGLMAPARVA
jgi:hypothetical protein